LNIVGEILGEVCKIIFPISEEIYLGNSKASISICTLSSMDLLKDIASSEIMNNVAIAGRLLSENKGIDQLVRNVIEQKNIKTIFLCGIDVLGHKPGHSLLALHKNGIDNDGRILNSMSNDPVLSLLKIQVKKFQKQVNIINKINETDLRKIRNEIKSILN